MSEIGDLFRSARIDRSMTRVDVVVAAQYTNVNKGLRRYDAIESGSDLTPTPSVRDRFARVLGIDDHRVFGAQCSDFTALDTPLPPTVTVRLVAAVYVPAKLPDGCTLDEAIRIAEDINRQGFRVWVRLSAVRSLCIRPDGSRCISTPPHTTFPDITR